jgi:hypothetical protein
MMEFDKLPLKEQANIARFRYILRKISELLGSEEYVHEESPEEVIVLRDKITVILEDAGQSMLKTDYKDKYEKSIKHHLILEGVIAEMVQESGHRCLVDDCPQVSCGEEECIAVIVEEYIERN